MTALVPWMHMCQLKMNCVVTCRLGYLWYKQCILGKLNGGHRPQWVMIRFVYHSFFILRPECSLLFSNNRLDKARRLLHTTEYLQKTEDTGGYYKFTGPVPQERLDIKFARSSGPGGQNVNKVNTKVEIRFHVETAEWIPQDVRTKLLQRERNRINKNGELVLTSTKFRSQQKNIEDGVSKIHSLIKDASFVPKATSPEQKQHVQRLARRFNERRLAEKKFSSMKKRERRGDD